MEQQQMAFPAVMTANSEEQIQLANDLHVITNYLGYKVIEVEQKDLRTRELQGIMVLKYEEVKDDDDFLAVSSGGEAIEVSDRYPHEIVGGTMAFVKNPYMTRPPLPGGTGNVVFLLDDNEDTPQGALSGESKGWNRELLASHFYDNMWHIVDDRIRAEIKQRADAIQKALKDNPMAVLSPKFRDETPDALPEGELEDPQGNAEDATGGMPAEIRAAPQMSMPGRPGDGLPSGPVRNPRDERIDGLEKRIEGIESGIGQILDKLNNPAPQLVMPEPDEVPPVGEKKEPEEPKTDAKSKKGKNGKKDKDEQKATTGGIEGGIAG